MVGFAFTGRQTQLETLFNLVDATALGRGGVALVEAQAGAGKTALVNEFRRRLATRPPADSVLIAQGNCSDGSSAENPFEPFAEALVNLAAPEGNNGRRRKSSLVVELLKTVAPDLMSMLPVIGPAAAAVSKAAASTGQWWLSAQPDELEALSRTILSQFIEAFVSIGDSRGPLVILIENAHWCDPSSAALLSRLSQRIETHPIVLVVTYRQEDIRQGHPLENSIVEMRMSGLTKRVKVGNFTPVELNEYVGQRYDREIADRLTGWLFSHCSGHPLMVISYLTVLEQSGALIEIPQGASDTAATPKSWLLATAPDDLEIPDSVEAVLTHRAKWLDDDQRRLMQVASVQGQDFLAAVLSQMLNLQEDQILSALKSVEAAHGLINEATPDDWARDWSDGFAFEHQLMRLMFYKDLTPLQRARYHSAVGMALLQQLDQAANPPRRLILQTARHLEAGRQWASAAAQFRRAARSCYLDGAFDEATRSAERGLACVQQLATRDDPELAWLEARTIQMLLICSELTWWNSLETTAGRPVVDLLATAEKAASRASDPQLVAELTFLRAKVTLFGDSLAESLHLFERAVDQARAAGDELGEVIGLTELGHHTVGINLERGLALLKRANELWMERLAQFELSISPTILSRHLSRLQVTIGAAYFDRGDFDNAQAWLDRSFNTLQHYRMPDLRVGMASLHAQFLIATGRFEEAETMLNDALAISFREEEGVIQRCYLLSLLGKLYLEWDRPEDANTPLQSAFETTQRSVNTAVLPLIRNYYCELLLREKASNYDPESAASILAVTIDETVRSGFHRSEVAARMLMAIVHRQKGEADEALVSSTHAVETLEKLGTLPVVRTEEVLFVQSQCLESAGQAAGAKVFLDQAHAEVMRKAGSISDQSARAIFLERVPLNRDIVKAWFVARGQVPR